MDTLVYFYYRWILRPYCQWKMNRYSKWWQKQPPWDVSNTDMKEWSEKYIPGKWRASDREYLLYRDVACRWRLVQERCDPLYQGWSMGRSEYFNNKGVDIDKIDDEAFAQALIDTLFQHTSYNSRKPILEKLVKMQNEHGGVPHIFIV